VLFFQKRIPSKQHIAIFHGHTILFQLCPKGPRERRIERCIRIATITAYERKRLLKKAIPIPVQINGTKMSNDSNTLSNAVGINAAKG